MRTAGHRPGDSLTPALLGALALHLGVLVVLLWRPAPPMSFGAAVPITIVAHDPTTDSRRAVAAPETRTAQTPAPVPAAAPPEPSPPPPPPQPRRPQPRVVEAPAPQPRPVPAKTAVKPTPTPRRPVPPAPPQPTPRTKAKASPQADTFSLDSLQADVARSLPKSRPRPSFAARGPTRVETAPAARVDAGKGVSQSDVAGLSQLLQRLWNVSCGSEEAVVAPVSFTVGDDGRLVGAVSAHGLQDSRDPAVAVAARRAIDAVHKAAPYGPAFRNNSFTVNFDAKKACANG